MDNVLNIERINWNDDIPVYLENAMKAQDDYFEREVLAGRCQLYRLGVATYMITREEYINDLRVLVVCCYEGRDIIKASRALIIQCRLQNFDGIRYHTSRPGMIRWGLQLGFVPIETNDDETIMYKQLNKVH